MPSDSRAGIAPAAEQRNRFRRTEKEADAFMRLPDHEITGCINDIGFDFKVADLRAPKPHQIQLVFEWFVSLLLNATPTTVEPAMRAAAGDVCGEHADIFSNTSSLIALWGSLRRVLHACGVNDFTLNDLSQPTYERVAKVFSYLINFVRFRESQTSVIDAHYSETVMMRSRIKRLYAESQDNQTRLRDMHREREAAAKTIRDLASRNEELMARLLELRDEQRGVAERLTKAKADKHALSESLKQQSDRKAILQEENASLRWYIAQTTSTLQNKLFEQREILDSGRVQIDALDRRTRALQTSADSFETVSTDLAACIKILDEIAAELGKEKKEMERNAKQRDALSQSGKEARELEQTEQTLRNQLSKWDERTQKLREQSGHKAFDAMEKMHQLRATHKRLTMEHAQNTKEMETRRVRIEQTEKKTLDLIENLENEIHAAYGEYLKMEAHIKLRRCDNYNDVPRRITLSQWKFGPAAMATPLSQIGHFSYSALEPVHTYVRRQSLSDQINHRLQGADTGHRKLVLLSGLAGSGKTQLALDYLQQFRSSYDATVWIEARARDTLERDFVNLYETLYQGRVVTVENPKAFESILIAIKAWFSRQQGPCLMVFDGANLADDETASDSIDLKHFLPNAPNLHIIITTRTSTALDMSPLRGVAVGAMELSQAVELFHKSSRIPQDDATVKDEVITIVRELGCIALAVSIAGTQIGRSPWLQSKVTAYLPDSDDFGNLLHQKPEPLVHQYDTSVHSVWQTALEASNKICPGAATLISVLSFLHHDDIFPSVFNASGQRGDGELNCSNELGWRTVQSAEPLSDIQMLERCFQALEGCCLVCWDGSQKTYHINRLVHSWARSRIPPSERCEISAAALTLLVEATKTCSHAPGDKLRLLPHLMATFRDLSTTEADSFALEKLEAFGRFARECGRPKEAKVVLEYVLQNRKRILGNDHPEVFVTMGYLATALADLGQFNEALGLIEKVLQFRAETDGEDHLDTIEATNILVIILRGLGRHAKAMHFSQDVLRKRSRLLGGEHPDTIGAVGNLATLYAELGHVDVAITMKEEEQRTAWASYGAKQANCSSL
ncbi:hypothetical protein Purlil1_14075 [Purpureocillium lilacinum]|uniref:Probable kinetochore protein NUF2 n=1 Tax=Purpureocillium lilacinum TaxID=33203 RepID=A0ABR0BCB3_PURLI|nr:hypothetical protein Purlil1_14075 [Purpureocillium lilacinum]